MVSDRGLLFDVRPAGRTNKAPARISGQGPPRSIVIV